jgi:[glutamine synthetase] adenylyltransferase / [glutamine synthetase]-adenylyl-L-tyrosine phosphorylase
LQAMHDQQVHHLPTAEQERARLALAMNFADWDSFRNALQAHRKIVEKHFQQVFVAPPEGVEPELEPLRELWLGHLKGEEIERTLQQAGFDDTGEAARLIGQLRSGNAPRYLGEQGRAHFDALVPMMLGAVGRESNAVEVLARLVRVLEQIAGRTTYLALLRESPQVLAQLVKLCAASDWIAQQIARFPLLLDQLLDPRTLYAPLLSEELEAELAQRLDEVAVDDLEQQMDGMRQFKHAMVLRVAAADVAGIIPLTVVSDRLTAIAEVVLKRVLAVAWAEMSKRYGQPRCSVGGRTRDVAFVVVGYGKLGGKELGYGSDLDLVFLHDSAGSDQKTSGRTSVDNPVFLTRLGQRMIHILETMTAAGVLYEVDMRLRPSGNAGLLVSGLDAFAEYQREEAWTWEHQSLVRARPVAGDPRLAQAFDRVRAEVLSVSRDPDKLRQDVCQMRERMRQELGSRGRSGFHLKQDPGGIVDIEFMVQYLVLRWCREQPRLLSHTDTIHHVDGRSRRRHLVRRQNGALARGHHPCADPYPALRHGRVRRRARLRNAGAGPGDFPPAGPYRPPVPFGHILGMPMPYDKKTLNQAQRAVVRDNNLKSGYLRPMAFYGSEAHGLRADPEGARDRRRLAVGRLSGQGSAGTAASGATSSFTRHHVNITMCKAKANGNYMNSMLALREARCWTATRKRCCSMWRATSPRAPARTCSSCATASCTRRI